MFYGDVSALSPEPGALPLSEYRREKLSRLRPESARRLGIGAELLLCLGLRELGLPLPPELRVGSGGKPYLTRGRPFFSLSHSGTLAACAISDRELGLDVQRLSPYREALARRICTPEERDWLLSQADRDGAFTRLWTRKESHAKATGLGMRLEFSSFSTMDTDAEYWETRVGETCFCLCQPGIRSPERFESVELAGAAALLSPEERKDQ